MTEQNHGTRAHSKLGGSTAHRWTNCPGSVFYLDALPEKPPGEAAVEGTLAHEIAEIKLDAFLQRKISGEDTEIFYKEDVSDEMKEGADFYCTSVWNELLEGAVTGKAYGLEERFTIDEHLHMGGIVDFWAVYIDDRAKRCGIVGDYKFGFTPVIAKDNAQLAFYAVALRKEMQRAGKDLDIVYGAIIQPRTSTPFQKVKFTAAQLDTWEKKFFKAAELIFVEKKPKFKVGDWCKFCDAKPICKEYTTKLKGTTALKLIDPEEVKLPVPETMSKESLIKVLQHYDTLKDFIDACYSYVLTQMKTGKKFPGLKLVEGKSRRKWATDDQAIIKGLTKHGIKPTEEKLKNLTTIEKELATIYDKETATEILAVHVEKTVPSISVVNESDPRPAVKNLVDML